MRVRVSMGAAAAALTCLAAIGSGGVCQGLAAQTAAEAAHLFWQRIGKQCGTSFLAAQGEASYGYGKGRTRRVGEFRGFRYTVSVGKLSEAEKLNGVEGRGVMVVHYTAGRTLDISKARWSQWSEEAAPETYDVKRMDGHWIINDKDTVDLIPTIPVSCSLLKDSTSFPTRKDPYNIKRLRAMTGTWTGTVWGGVVPARRSLRAVVHLSYADSTFSGTAKYPTENCEDSLTLGGFESGSVWFGERPIGKGVMCRTANASGISVEDAPIRGIRAWKAMEFSWGTMVRGRYGWSMDSTDIWKNVWSGVLHRVDSTSASGNQR